MQLLCNVVFESQTMYTIKYSLRNMFAYDLKYIRDLQSNDKYLSVLVIDFRREKSENK